MKKQIEERTYMCGIEAREDGEHGHMIEGVPIVFNQETDLGFCREKIDPNALAKTDMKDVKFLVNHDTNQLPLARSRNNTANSTMQLSVMQDGLHFRADLDTENNPRAKELESAVKRQDVTGMSFMFTVSEEKWDGVDTASPLRTILGIDKVYEVSAVTFPAYEQTSISARSLDSVRASLDSEKKALDNAREIERMRMDIKKRVEVLMNDKTN